MDFSRMKALTRTLLGETDENNTYFPTPEIEAMLNDSMLQAAIDLQDSMLSFRDYSTVQGTDRYALQQDMLKVVSVMLFISTTYKRKMKYRTLDQFDEISSGSYLMQGQPTFYKVERGETQITQTFTGDFWVYPVPDDNGGADYTLRVYFNQKPSTLSTDTDVSELPEYAHMAACYYAAAMLSLKQQDGAGFDRMMTMYLTGIDKAKAIVLTNQDDDNVHPHDGMGYTETEF